VESARQGEIATGLLYLDETTPDMHQVSATTGERLWDLPFERLCPGSAELAKFQARLR
jgi:2-oxoglutarate ferredoxin oxidoreductase subunit beta